MNQCGRQRIVDAEPFHIAAVYRPAIVSDQTHTHTQYTVSYAGVQFGQNVARFKLQQFTSSLRGLLTDSVVCIPAATYGVTTR